MNTRLSARIGDVHDPLDREVLPTLIFSRLRGFFLLACASVPFGIILHLLTEAAALGAQHIGSQFFARHEYFIVFAVVSSLLGIALARPYTQLGSSALTAALMRDLPFHGSKREMFASAFALQFAFLGITIAAESRSISCSDWLSTGIVALIVATVGSSALSLLPRQFIHVFAARHIVRHELYRRTILRGLIRFITSNCAIVSGYRTTLGNRPPPFVLG